MNDFEFFVGDREVDQFTLFLHKGKAQLSCRVFERWEERTSRSLNCGMKRKRTLKKTIGISEVEHEELESTISGTFGLEGIAGFRSELRGKLSRELGLQISHEEEEEFEFEAPPCGRRTVRVYQLVRIYHLSFKDSRSWFFRKGDLFKIVTEGLDRIYDRSIKIENDPDCGCKPQTSVEVDGLVNIDLGKIAILAGYRETKNGIELPDLGMLVNAGSVRELMFSTVKFPSDAIPAYLRFLADESRAYLNGRFFPELGLENVTETRSGPKRHRAELFDNLVLGSVGALAAVLLYKKAQREEKKRRESIEQSAQEARRHLRETVGQFAGTAHSTTTTSYRTENSSAPKAGYEK